MIGKLMLSMIGVCMLFTSCIGEECKTNRGEKFIHLKVMSLLSDSLNSFGTLFPYSFRMRIYSSKEGVPISYDFVGRETDFSLPFAHYRILLYSSDFYEVDAVFYRRLETAETAEAYSSQKTVGEINYIEQPDPTFSSYTDLVSDPSIHLLHVVMNPRVFTYRFRISVEGLEYVKKAQAFISGQYASVYLKDGTHREEPPVCVRTDLLLKDHCVEGEFRSFGSHQKKEIAHQVVVCFTNALGEIKTVELNELTSVIKALPRGGEFVINQQIVITGGDVNGGFQPGIADWEDKEVTLPI